MRDLISQLVQEVHRYFFFLGEIKLMLSRWKYADQEIINPEHAINSISRDVKHLNLEASQVFFSLSFWQWVWWYDNNTNALILVIISNERI